MAFLIFLMFLAVPIIEIAVFIQVGDQIGLWNTIGIVILTAVLGTWMLRREGISILFRIRENLEANRMPVQEMFDGVCLVVAGALLLTPGFVTDAIGFLLFVPPVRHFLAGAIAARVLANAEVHYTHTHTHTHHSSGPARPDGRGPIIDGDFTDVTPGEDRPDDKKLPGDRTDGS